MNRLNTASGERSLPPMPTEAITLARGDVFHHVMAGGGGFGDALERDPAMVLEDVLDEKVSHAAARSAYGVVLQDERVDEAGTAGLRQALRATASGGSERA